MDDGVFFPPLEIGEKIVCTAQDLGYNLTVGQTYTVQFNFNHRGQRNWIMLDELRGLFPETLFDRGG